MILGLSMDDLHECFFQVAEARWLDFCCQFIRVWLGSRPVCQLCVGNCEKRFMLVLGIETSGLTGSIALIRNDVCLGERRLDEVGRRHAQSLVLEIRELLMTCELKPQDVQMIAVSRGPGSFTGLRVGMVCAKTFAYATNCQFIAVDTFAAIAENLSAKEERVFVIEDAQRDDLFVGEYRRNGSEQWTLASPIRIVSRVEFLNDRTASDIVTGPGLRKLDQADVQANWLTGVEFCTPRALSIAILGHRQMTSNWPVAAESDTDFWRATPFYLRMSAAEEKRATQQTIL